MSPSPSMVILTVLLEHFACICIYIYLYICHPHIITLYMCVCVWDVHDYECVHALVHAHVCVGIEARGQCWVPSPITLHLAFWDKVSY